MGEITRHPDKAGKYVYDVIIIGGGIYGVTLSLEASRRNLRTLLIEKNDFGGATSFNSLRILHGGLRYLQSLDYRRFSKSVGERRWLLRNFPGLVQPVPCLMPLYGKGLRRRSVFRAAICLNDILSWNRNRFVLPDRHLPGGRVINPLQTATIFPGVDTDGLEGGAVWYDALMPDSQRLLIEILRWSCALGATALNYVEAVRLLTTGKGVAGVVGIDRENGQTHEFKAGTVINAAGPWCREIAKKFDRDYPFLFRSSLAWNVLFNREALSGYCLAVAPKRRGGRIYFLLPWKGMLLAGTGHAAGGGIESPPKPDPGLLREFIDDLNLAVPGLEVRERDILRIFAGYLPAAQEGSAELAVRETILDHGKHGGPRGLVSVSGVKYTTARRVAETTLDRMARNQLLNAGRRQRPLLPRDGNGFPAFMQLDFHDVPDIDTPEWRRELRRIIEEESVVHLNDLIFRRTSLGDNPKRARQITPFLCPLFGWGPKRSAKEAEWVERFLERSWFVAETEEAPDGQ